MSAPITIVNGEGGQRRSVIVNENFALRIESSVPVVLPNGTPNRARYYNDYIYNAGDFNMAVDGSVTPVEFTVAASPDYDLYITKVLILLASNQIANNKFADLAALTNGWSLYAVEQGEQTFIIQDVTTTGEMTIASGGAFIDLANWNVANDNARSISINIAAAFPFETQRGIRIGRGSKDRFAGLVSDDLSSISEFTVRVIGTRHYP